MLKLSLNESNYNEVMREIENKQDIETTFRTYTTLDTSNKRYSVYSIYVEYRDVADFGSRNYQWVLAGYTDNGVLYLTADEINNYNLNPYMNGEVITNLEGMIQDYPEAFYIEDVITENLNEDTFSNVNYVLSMFEDDDNLDKLYDIADRYNTSSPVSGNWDTETKHQQKTIAKEFNISLEDAKDVMINILGFEEEMFNENKSFKNRKRYTKQFNETTYTKNSFKIGDKVRSKPTYKNPANIGFCGTIIDIDKNGLCTIECADGTVIDNINPDRIVYDNISDKNRKRYTKQSKKVTESVSSSTIDAFLNADIKDYDNFYKTLDTVWKEFINEYAPLCRNWDSVSDDDKRGELYNKYRPVVDKCKETLKALSITGYGGLKDVYKGYIEELCKKFDYKFPFGWKQHGDWILRYGK